MDYESYMEQAIKEAEKAFAISETPIGAIIVCENKIIATGYNKRNSTKNPLAHAEIIAINQAANYIGDWRLENCEMYITLEPCPMCAGAIVQSRIPKIIFGAKNPKAGCAGSIMNLLQTKELNHQVEIIDGILENRCSTIMKEFFKQCRENKINL